jgi:hypothetical protein
MAKICKCKSHWESQSINKSVGGVLLCPISINVKMDQVIFGKYN